MYINEVIRRVDALDPNEYSLEEKYAWCDELNAMLMQEYLKPYARVELEPDDDNTYLLPEGITFEMVDKIIAQGREIQKYDFRSFGIIPKYTPHERIYVPAHCQEGGKITVIYLAQCEPIRTVSENVTIRKDSNSIYFHSENTRFVVGDTVDIEFDSGEKILENNRLSVIDVYPDEGSWYIVDLKKTGMVGTQADAKVTRVVTDETLCGAPYDQMYVDFVGAKIAYYQRNFVVYNQLMNAFNVKLRAFHNWLMDRRTETNTNQIYNWW